MQRSAWTRRGSIRNIGQTIFADTNRCRCIIWTGGDLDAVGTLILQTKIGCIRHPVTRIASSVVAIQIRIGNVGTIGIALGVVGQTHGHGHGHEHLWPTTGGEIMADDIDRRTFAIINDIEIRPVDIGVPHVRLAVRDRTTPAFTRAFALAGTQTFRVLLPGQHETDVLDAMHFQAIGIAATGSQALGLGPHHVGGLGLIGARVITRQ